MASASAEQAVKKLARLPSNTVCPNCGTTKKFGFSTVCIKYLTFVCNNCKSSHQAVSHRCKSLTMSSWTDGEVLQLKMHGNDHARATWLAKAPPVGSNGRPCEGDPIDVFKRFIVDAYEHKKYYSEAGVSPSGIPQAPRSAPVRMPVPQAAPPAPPPRAKTPPPPVAPRAPAPAPAVDLFSFDVAGTTTTTSAAPAAPTHDPFAPQPVASAPTAITADPFAASTSIPSAPVSAPAPSFDLFQSTNNSSNNVAAPPAKKPIMMSSGQSNLISNMDSMMPPSSGGNNSSGGNSGFGFMSQNNTGMMNPMMMNGMMGNSNNGNMNHMTPMQQQQMQMMMMQQQMGRNTGMGMMTMNNNNNQPMGGGFGNNNMGMGGFGAFSNNGGMMGANNNINHMGNSHQQGPHTSTMNYMQTSHGSTISSNFGAQAAGKKNDKPDPFANLF